MTTVAAERSFDGFRKPKTPGLGGLGSIGTAILIAASVVAVIVAILVSLVDAVVWGAVAGLALLTVAVRDKHGVSVLERAGVKVAHARAVRTGTNHYHSGPTTKLGSFTLPGVLASSALSEHVDQSGQPFALLHMPRVDHYTVVLEAYPDSSSLIDREHQLGQVDRFGDMLSSLAAEPGLLQLAVPVQTGPDDGAGLAAELGQIDPTDDGIGARIVSEIGDTYPAESSKVRTFVALTFNGREGKKARTPEEMADTLGHRLPEIQRQMTATGAGDVHLVNGQTLCAVTRAAYDPASEEHMTGDRPTVITWAGVGPVRAINHWTHYQHDSAVSVTWTMSTIIGRIHGAAGLAPLLRPHPGLPRKRVTLIYTPHPPEVSQRLAAKDLRAAEHRLLVVKTPSAADRKDLAAADATATEEAHGNAICDVAVIVTVTVPTEADIPAAAAVIDSIGPAARLQLRPEHGGHAAAFAAGLPLGLITAAHSMVPKQLREAL